MLIGCQLSPNVNKQTSKSQNICSSVLQVLQLHLMRKHTIPVQCQTKLPFLLFASSRDIFASMYT